MLTPDIRTYLELQLKHARLQAFFRNMPAFARLPAEAVAGVVLAELEPVVLDAGEFVYRHGDPAGPLYLIEQGRVRVLQSANGRSHYVATLGAGESFGIVSAVRRSPRTTTVETMTSVRLLTLSGETLERLAAALPQFRTMLDDWIAQHDFRNIANVPADIDQELLPAGAAAQQSVSDAQVDQTEDEVDEADLDAPFAEGGHFVKAHRRRRVPFVRQIDETDCGAASLAIVCRAFRPRRESGPYPSAGPHQPGRDEPPRAVPAAGARPGAARGQGLAGHLDQMPLPAIVHWDRNHWLVLTVGRRRVQGMDPAIGRPSLPRAEFERKWTGYAALFDFTDAFARPRGARRSRGCCRSSRRSSASSSGPGARRGRSLLQMAIPVFTQVVVDRVVVEQDLQF